ncbi:MAG TPA: hypothetical protein VMR74_13550 [Gammaproteobacteria bacterium]|nr:hypothetical protein [Gammaproteobacteria bacterium]
MPEAALARCHGADESRSEAAAEAVAVVADRGLGVPARVVVHLAVRALKLDLVADVARIERDALGQRNAAEDLEPFDRGLTHVLESPVRKRRLAEVKVDDVFDIAPERRDRILRHRSGVVLLWVQQRADTSRADASIVRN